MRVIIRSIAHLSKYPTNQLKTLSDEMILVDPSDTVVGRIDKHQAHTNSWIFSASGLPHRAFSVFIFNSNHELLLQQRSSHKITFPLYWTNSCCSHPVKHETSTGLVSESKERTLFELGIDLDKKGFQLELVSKVLYRARFDEYWGEYELDYLIFVKVREKELEIGFNKEEINDVKWIDEGSVRKFVNGGERITPWFHRIVMQTEFTRWWKTFCCEERTTWEWQKVITLDGE